MIAILAAAALAGAAAPPSDGADRLAELRHMYQQSCEVRAYATFDDLCDTLKKQMREAERVERSAARDRARPGSSPAAVKPPADTPLALRD